jgi:hypothetical protein
MDSWERLSRLVLDQQAVRQWQHEMKWGGEMDDVYEECLAENEMYDEYEREFGVEV